MIQQFHSWACIQRKPYWKDMCAPVFMTALFTIAKTRKQSNCPSTDEWIKKMWYMYRVEYYSAPPQKTKIMPFSATWMDVEIIILSKVRERQITCIANMWNLIKGYKWTYFQNKQIHRHRMQSYGYQRVKREKG